MKEARAEKKRADTREGERKGMKKSKYSLIQRIANHSKLLIQWLTFTHPG